ncbi:MAG: phage tail protein [Gloeotrichia echinulata IR180]
MLLGVDDTVPILKDDIKFQPLEQAIASIATLFDPKSTPKEFLNWLAGWVALSLRDDWEQEAQRRFISRIVSLYKQRGTKAGMTEMRFLRT